MDTKTNLEDSLLQLANTALINTSENTDVKTTGRKQTLDSDVPGVIQTNVRDTKRAKPMGGGLEKHLLFSGTFTKALHSLITPNCNIQEVIQLMEEASLNPKISANGLGLIHALLAWQYLKLGMTATEKTSTARFNFKAKTTLEYGIGVIKDFYQRQLTGDTLKQTLDKLNEYSKQSLVNRKILGEPGYKAAVFSMGICYLFGMGVQRDPMRALAFFSTCNQIKQSNHMACVHILTAYIHMQSDCEHWYVSAVRSELQTLEYLTVESFKNLLKKGLVPVIAD